jgi:hypothetical protein
MRARMVATTVHGLMVREAVAKTLSTGLAISAAANWERPLSASIDWTTLAFGTAAMAEEGSASGVFFLLVVGRLVSKAGGGGRDASVVESDRIAHASAGSQAETIQ